MNRNHLAIFQAVAEAGSISGGAERLHISQPAVSKQLREFEHHLEVTLFDRLPKGVRLTREGEMLLSFAQRISRLEQEAERLLAEMRDLQAGKLALGASTTIGSYLLPTVIAAYQTRYPQVDITLEIANTDEIQAKLLNNTLDLAFTEGFVENSELVATTFAMDELVVISSPQHRFAERKDLKTEELCHEQCILREAGSGTRAVIERFLASRGLSPQVHLSLGSTEAIKQAVASNAGIAVVSRLSVETELATGVLKLLPVVDFDLQRPLHQVQLHNKHRSRALEAFLVELSQTLENAKARTAL